MRVQNKSRIYQQGKLHKLKDKVFPDPTSPLTVYQQAVASGWRASTGRPMKTRTLSIASKSMPLPVLRSSPISRIPDNIIHCIFNCLASDPLPFSLTGTCGVRPLGITLSHVCRRWHEIAYRHARLWTHIPLYNVHFTDLALKNSVSRGQPGDALQPLPISITASWGEDRSSWPSHEALRHALHSLERVYELSLVVLSPDIAAFRGIKNVTDLIFRRSAPMMESFRIHIRENDGETPLRLSACMFNGQTPRLRHLEMFNVSMLPTSEILQVDLTSLVLNCALVWTDMDDFLEGLLRLPSLQELVLYYPPDHLNNHEIDPRKTWPSDPHALHSIVLPHLRSARFDDHISRLPCLLQYLYFPPGADISLNMAVVGSEDPDFVSGVIHEFLPGVAHAVNDIYMCFPWYDRIACEGATIQYAPQSIGITPTLASAVVDVFPQVALNLYWSQPPIPSALASLPADLLSIFPGMQAARTLRVHDPFIPNPSDSHFSWLDLDSRFRLVNITHLHLHRCAVFAFFNALQAYDPSVDGMAFFPHLLAIILDGFDASSATGNREALRYLERYMAARSPSVRVIQRGAVVPDNFPRSRELPLRRGVAAITGQQF